MDEVQDTNEVQDQLVRALVGEHGSLTAVGDHRQAIFGWRGGLVDLMARLDRELKADADGETVNLSANFRSTPGIIKVSNAWSATLGRLLDMDTAMMIHGRDGRDDRAYGDLGLLEFDDRADEAAWITEVIRDLCPDDTTGARHDTADGHRGISYADVAVLVRSTTDARTYMSALEAAGIPAVFRAGPDLFGQPEVLLFLSLLAAAAGDKEFVGGFRGLPPRIMKCLGCGSGTEEVIRAACRRLGAQRGSDSTSRSKSVSFSHRD